MNKKTFDRIYSQVNKNLIILGIIIYLGIISIIIISDKKYIIENENKQSVQLIKIKKDIIILENRLELIIEQNGLEPIK